MNPDGIDSIAWMQQLAGWVDRLEKPAEIEASPDDLGYLLDALDPEFQPPAHQWVDILRARLDQVKQ